MIVVLDCNVVVSAGATDGFVRRVLRAIIADHEIIVSVDILAEYERVSRYPKFGEQTAVNLQNIITRIGRRARIIEAPPSGVHLPDPDDIPYVDAALAGAADVLITGNLKHFPERRYGALGIVSVREFAALAEIP